MTRLLVAAGGGGDALAAAIIHHATTPDEPAVIATYAWERLRVDPLPGPRGVDDFAGLHWLGPRVPVITPATAARAPATSMLPRLAAELTVTLVLLDPGEGATGLAAQLGELVVHTGARHIDIVDVGGDAVARGDEPGLRSPLGDALSVAACARLDTPSELLVAGPGLDGELSEAEVRARLDREPVTELDAADVSGFASTLAWHPSEATGMLAAAARGVRGTVEVRDQGLHVALTEHSPRVYRGDWDTVLTSSMLVPALRASNSFDDAEETTRRVVGVCELDAERRKAARLARQPPTAAPGPDELVEQVARVEREARGRGADYVTIRRLAEALDLAPAAAARLRADLVAVRPEHDEPPLWSVRPVAAGR